MKQSILIATACFFFVTSAHATVYPPVVVPKPIPSVGTSSAAGAAATGGFLGFVAALAGYDIIRRWTCSGDFLGLGGPGFSEPMPAHGNVKPPPVCAGDPRTVRVRRATIHNK